MPKGTTAELFSARRGAKADLPDPIGLRQRIISAAPDILCTYDSRGLDAAAVNASGPRLPHIHFEDAACAADDAQLGRRLRSAALAGAIIIVPTATLERTALKAWRVPMERLRRIPFGIDLKRLSPLAARDGARPVVTVGAIGELVLDGNFWRLIKAFAAMRARVAAHLAIFGDGPARPELESLARASGARSRIFFLRRPRKIETALSQIDVYASPCGAEEAAITLAEAMGSGLPALLPADQSAHAILSVQNARLLPPPGDDAAYGAALTRLVNDRPLRLRVGTANAGKAAAEYDLDKVIGQHVAVFKSLLAGRT